MAYLSHNLKVAGSNPAPATTETDRSVTGVSVFSFPASFAADAAVESPHLGVEGVDEARHSAHGFGWGDTAGRALHTRHVLTQNP